ncbi:MAG: dTMP kinase [Coriobacteriia bacterium]|nr:dTMP kinase [Coriobacteriia bacterium]
MSGGGMSLPKKGVFISFEGGEGVGKSTHVRLLAARLEAAGLDVVCLREPGGTPIGEKIRTILLDPANTGMSPMTELLLYEAARSQLVSERIRPALEAGSVVLCDRYLDSTAAYQGAGRSINPELIEQANALGSQKVLPDRTIVLLDDLEPALGRATEAGADRLEAEGLAFHRRVAQGFQELALANPGRIHIVKIAEDKRETAWLVFQAVADLFGPGLPQDFNISDELLAESRREHSR